MPYVVLDLKYIHILSLNYNSPIPKQFLPICNWTKHSPTGISASPLALKIFLLHFVNLGQFLSYHKNILP